MQCRAQLLLLSVGDHACWWRYGRHERPHDTQNSRNKMKVGFRQVPQQGELIFLQWRCSRCRLLSLWKTPRCGKPRNDTDGFPGHKRSLSCSVTILSLFCFWERSMQVTVWDVPADKWSFKWTEWYSHVFQLRRLLIRHCLLRKECRCAVSVERSTLQPALQCNTRILTLHTMQKRMWFES